MRHISQQVGSNLVTNLPKGVILQEPGIGRGSSNDHLGPEKPRVLHQFLVVDQASLGVKLVRHGLKVDGSGRDFLGWSEEAVGQAGIGKVSMKA